MIRIILDGMILKNPKLVSLNIDNVIQNHSDIELTLSIDNINDFMEDKTYQNLSMNTKKKIFTNTIHSGMANCVYIKIIDNEFIIIKTKILHENIQTINKILRKAK